MRGMGCNKRSYILGPKDVPAVNEHTLYTWVTFCSVHLTGEKLQHMLHAHKICTEPVVVGVLCSVPY